MCWMELSDCFVLFTEHQFNPEEGATFLDDYDDVESITSIRLGAEDIQKLEADLYFSDFSDVDEDAIKPSPGTVSAAENQTKQNVLKNSYGE